MFNGIYNRRRVLITGVTGFKGSWLALWLTRQGAEVFGYSLPPPTEPSHFRLLNLDLDLVESDVRDGARLRETMDRVSPEIVFHLAAQPLVRLSYRDPVGTYTTNVIGTVNVLEACRQCDSVRAIVVVTSDKCYENREWSWGYRENDSLGGYDPYSSSKACAELVTASWRQSFFNPADYGSKHQTLVASVRAGNVIGGGDWAEDRLIPDLVKAAAVKTTVNIRNPRAVRPWQHVLEPLCGYLSVGEKLLSGQKDFASAWNFGPDEYASLSVGDAVALLQREWPQIKADFSVPSGEQPHEAGLLKLDSARARTLLGWRPVWNAGETFAATASWYRNYYESGQVDSNADLNRYEQLIAARG